LVGLSIILALGISIWAVYQTEQTSFMERTLELNKINSQRLANTTSSLFQSMRESLVLTAGALVKHSDDNEEVQYHLDLLKASTNNFNSTMFVDQTGTIIATSPSSLNITGKKLTSNEIKQALIKRLPLISEPYKAITGNYIVLISQPIFNNNAEYIGLTAGTIYLAEKNVFKEILEKDSKGLNGSYSYVVDHSGTLLYHPDPTRIGENISYNAVVKLIMSSQVSGGQEIVNGKGEGMLSSFVLVPESGWGVVTQTPSVETLNLTRKSIQKIIIYALPLVIVLLILAWWMSTKIANPLTQLARFARNFSSAEQENAVFPEIKHWNYEANELNKAIVKAVNVLQERVEHFTLESQTDALTGLMNRRSIDSYLDIWVEQQVPFSIILLDLDFFKEVNDSHGHLMGDEVLKFVAGVMLSEVRPEDLCCRFGGEEFVLLLPRIHLDIAYKVAERIRLRMELSSNPIGRPVTLSLGVAAFPDSADTSIQLFERVDQALYRAKQKGRNQTVIYETEVE
jgi:diguanylate cyclase (GGDEF)-like protein